MNQINSVFYAFSMLFDRFMGKFHKFWLQNIINFTY